MASEVLFAHGLHLGLWLALAASVAAGPLAFFCLRQHPASRSAAALYALGLMVITVAQIQRGYAPAKFFVWGGLCEWSGFVLVTALVGWAFPRILAHRSAAPAGAWSAGAGRWFLLLQGALALAIATLALWIALDFSFDGLGEGVALFGWSGRRAACPALLMLLGATILMAWQTRGSWRVGWQFAAMLAGVLFTSSLGWARLDPAAGAPWSQRGVNLLLSASMMTLLTSFGLARVLPRAGDWITAGRRVAPLFGGLALLLLASVLAGQAWQAVAGH